MYCRGSAGDDGEMLVCHGDLRRTSVWRDPIESTPEVQQVAAFDRKCSQLS